MDDQVREWIIYFTGFGWVGHPIGCYKTDDAAMSRAVIGQPVEWVQTNKNGYVGYPFGNHGSTFFYTVNQDGRDVYDALIGADEQAEVRPNPAQQMARFLAWHTLKRLIP